MSRRFFSTCISAALVLLAAEGAAWAQACCASPTAFAPARLRVGEDALVGFTANASWVTGSFDRTRSYTSLGPGSREVDLGQRLFVAAAPWKYTELAFTIPLAETYRASNGRKETGGGLGDLRLASRWTVVAPGTDKVVPGIAVLSALTLPSGTPTEATHTPLATASTSPGVWQIDTGLALEQPFGRFLVNLTGTVGWRAPRAMQGMHSQLGPAFSLFVGASYTFKSMLSLGVSASYDASLDARVSGVDAPDSATAKTTLALSGALPVGKGVRLLASTTWVPNVDYLGKNDTASVGVSLGVVYAWGGPRSCPMHPGVTDCGCPP